MVAGLHRFDARADVLDHARPLVPQDDRHGHQQIALHDVQVAVAHATGVQPHQHLTGLRRGDFDFFKP